MDEHEFLAERFEAHRDHLRAVAYRMLGSLTEAEDAVQEAWLRLSRSDTSDVANLGGWLTTVVSRVCLDMLRSRRSRREEPLDTYVPDPIVTLDPAEEAVLADSVGLALLVLLETLTPAERLALVLHDMFGVPYNEIGPIVGRSAATATQLASRARRRVRNAALPDTDPAAQRELVDAFMQASRAGDLDALLTMLAPDAVLRRDGGTTLPSTALRGATPIATQSAGSARPGAIFHPALVNGSPGIIITLHTTPVAVLGFTISAGKITEIDVLTDPHRLPTLNLPTLN